MNGRSSLILRFVVVGGINTAVDMVLFSILTVIFHWNVFAANILSTSTALAVSYTLHSRFTFVSIMTVRRLILFTVITLSGLWLLQPFVILLLTPPLQAVIPIGQNYMLPVVAAKLLSIGVTLTWNYVWYSKIIFNREKASKLQNQYRHTFN